jgi:Cytochrome P460
MSSAMKRVLAYLAAIFAIAFAVLSYTVSSAQSKQDKYTLKVPGGLAFSDFKGYEDWQSVSPSKTDAQSVIRLIVANPVMINAYRQGVPANGKPFPEGSKIAKMVWNQKKLTSPPFSASTPDTVPGDLTEVELIEKDSKRFADTHGWGYAVFDYDAASGVHSCYRDQQVPAGARRQMRRCMPPIGGVQGLHFHHIPQ